MRYTRCGRSGLELPKLSLGLWHNFGDFDDFENARAMLHTAFDLGITHLDLANNYRPPARGSRVSMPEDPRSGFQSPP
jgi:L-glyceraldehyde 3-phosphate reductase